MLPRLSAIGIRQLLVCRDLSVAGVDLVIPDKYPDRISRGYLELGPFCVRIPTIERYVSTRYEF